jgi:hypothetical protein
MIDVDFANDMKFGGGGLERCDSILLLDSIDVTELSGFRDRALIGVIAYSFARVSAKAPLRVEDYFEHGKQAWLRLHARG